MEQIRALWEELQAHGVDCIIEVTNRGNRFRAASGLRSDYGNVILRGRNTRALAIHCRNAMNAAIEDPDRRWVVISGTRVRSLPRAAADHLGIKTHPSRQLAPETREKQSRTIVEAALGKLGMLQNP